MADITFYISLVSGALLTISEIMPYITKIQSNGILHSITNFLTSKAANSDAETRPLLPQSEQQHVVSNNNSQILQQYLQQYLEQHREISKKLEEIKTASPRVLVNELEDKRITIVIE